MLQTLMQLGLNLIYGSNPPIFSKNIKLSGNSAQNKKCEDEALINIF